MNLIVLKVLTTAMFLISGVYKLIDPSIGIAKLMKCSPFLKNDSTVYYIVLLAGIWEIVASMYVYFGSRNNQKLALYSLVVFTILATLLCHFPPVGNVYYPFISNVTTIGGLLSLAYLV
tara:strand:- start:2263 stop:2619 length:357 start_codon:yes stop_codon:yes gene_type:complete